MLLALVCPGHISIATVVPLSLLCFHPQRFTKIKHVKVSELEAPTRFSNGSSENQNLLRTKYIISYYLENMKLKTLLEGREGSMLSNVDSMEKLSQNQ